MPKRSHSIKFSKETARTVRTAANKKDMTFSAFVEAAALKEARDVLDRKICPTCGRMHDQV
jgi:uncharacterized protein (DUF1778 family)